MAWMPLGWTCAWVSEIDPFCCKLLAARHPGIPNLGDMTKITEADLEEHGRIDLLVGGTPCQSFSVAGLRRGLSDDRGNLALRFCQLALALQPRWVVWENVPGVLSSGGGRDFGAILGALVECGYGLFYRVLDAQFIRVQQYARAVPQRRRRVFVIGYLGDWRRAAAVLLERQSLSGNPPPRREAGKGLAPTIAARVRGGGGLGTDFDCDGGLIHSVSPAMKARDGKGPSGDGDGDGDGLPLIPCAVAFDTTQITSAANYSKPKPGDPCHPLAAGAHPPAVAFAQNQDGHVCESDVVNALSTEQTHASARACGKVRMGMAVRRLTPRECERLQGFPDDYTKLDAKTADGPRYRALGNSMAVNVMRWIGQRIQAVESLTPQRKPHD